MVDPYEIKNGEEIGRDPRTLTPEELAELGHVRRPLSKVIRAHCLDCCFNQPGEVRRCTVDRCPFWLRRMGTNPLRKKSELSEEEGALRAARFKKT